MLKKVIPMKLLILVHVIQYIIIIKYLIVFKPFENIVLLLLDQDRKKSLKIMKK